MLTSLQPQATPASTVAEPDAGNKRLIETEASADIAMCWTCSSCDLECPMNIATNMLRPQKIVRLSNLGMLDELLCLPEIWYCLTCRRCARICPNSVKPSSLISFARKEALKRGVISWPKFRDYADLFTRFQRVRRRAVSACMQGIIPAVTADRWQKWIETPLLERPGKPISGNVHSRSFKAHSDLYQATKGALCYTCGECSSACPVSGHRTVFDPRSIFRMVQLGLVEEAFQSPDIWLCLNCGRCTDACPQQVDGRAIIEHLRLLAVKKGIVDRGFPNQLQLADNNLFPWFVDAVGGLMGHERQNYTDAMQGTGSGSRSEILCSL